MPKQSQFRLRSGAGRTPSFNFAFNNVSQAERLSRGLVAHTSRQLAPSGTSSSHVQSCSDTAFGQTAASVGSTSSSSFACSFNNSSHTSTSSFCSIFDRNCKLVSWNGRTIVSSSPRFRGRKLAILWKLLYSYDIVYLQEMHGTPEQVDLLFNRLRDTHFFFYSLLERSAGGVGIFVRKASFHSSSPPHMTIVVPGRALKVQMFFHCEPTMFFMEHSSLWVYLSSV